MYDLNRFLTAQSRDYAAALREIRSGRKRSHWIWYIFPQVAGLGMSSTSQYYAISGLDEARAYLREPTLRAHLLERCEATLEDLFLGEPVYVEISVSVWAETANPAGAFEEQERLRRRIAEYLDPMTGGSGSGTAKAAAAFADGTVLALLKAGERDNNADPWADECKYLAAAGKTLPVFKGQGDEHTHNGNWTSNGNGKHSRRCTCNVVETQNCSGGTATCIEKAKCAVCGAEYDDVLGHDFTTSWTHDDNEHWKQCSRCDEKDDVGPHTWNSGTVTTAPTCTKAGEKTYSCNKCDATKIEPIPATGHSWKSDWTSDATHHWHECTNKNCDVTDNAGKKGYAEHSGGKATCTQNAVCEFCKAEYGEKLPHDFTAETVDAKYLKSAASCTEKAVYYKSCTVCGLSSEGTADEATFFSGNALDHDWGAWTSNEDGTHTRTCTVDGCSAGMQTENCIDADKDHKCDICDYIISECADDNKDHKCDYCGKKLTDHTGGKATCKDKAKCEVCGAEYGELDPKNHTGLKHFPAKAATKTTEGNIEYWYCGGCGKYFSDRDGTKEIKKADTVTAKLKDDSKLPQTGDISNLALWIALLFVSGGAAIGTTIVSRKKKYNR